jgi:hypothetical protein
MTVQSWANTYVFPGRNEYRVLETYHLPSFGRLFLRYNVAIEGPSIGGVPL